jgi:hypothetical protein
MAWAVERRARRCARWPKKWAAKNAKDRCICGQSMNLGVLRSKIRCEINSRRTEYEKGSSVIDYYKWFGNEKYFHKDGASNLDRWPETMPASQFNSSDLLHSAKIFDRGITGDKTWCFYYDPETKGQSMQWKQNPPRPKNHAFLARSLVPCLCVPSITRG